MMHTKFPRWRWQSFGGQPMLVTDGGGAKVVLTAGKSRKTGQPELRTRDPENGVLVAVTGDERCARWVASAPHLAESLLVLVRQSEDIARRMRIDPRKEAADNPHSAMALAYEALAAAGVEI